MIEYLIRVEKTRRIKIRSEINLNNQIDFQLIQAFLEGSSESFTQIITNYKNMVFNLCYRIMTDYDEADDQAQEVFIKLYKKLHTFKFNCSFSTWLYRVTVNQCRNRLTTRAYRRSRNTKELITYASRIPSPEIQFELKQQKLKLRDALGKLPFQQKLLIILRDMEGKSYEEIGLLTSLKQGTLKSRLSRARLKLNNLLKENDQ